MDCILGLSWRAGVGKKTSASFFINRMIPIKCNGIAASTRPPQKLRHSCSARLDGGPLSETPFKFLCVTFHISVDFHETACREMRSVGTFLGLSFDLKRECSGARLHHPLFFYSKPSLPKGTTLTLLSNWKVEWCGSAEWDNSWEQISKCFWMHSGILIDPLEVALYCCYSCKATTY